jgi:hypothetical protein
MRDLLTEVLLSLRHRTLSYGLAVLSLGLGLGAFICLSALGRAFGDGLERRVSPSFGSEFSLEAGPTISLEVGAKREALNVEQVTTRVRQAAGGGVAALATGTFDVKVGRHALREMRVLAVSGGWLRLQPHLWGIQDTIAGRRFTPQDDASGEAVCIIDTRLARALPSPDAPIGQRLSVNGRPFRVVGVVSLPRGIGNYGLLLLSFSAAQPLLRQSPPGSMSFLMGAEESRVQTELDRVERAVSQSLGPGYVVAATSPWLDLEEARNQLAYTRLYLRLLCFVPLIVGLLAMVSMLLANLNTRLREIGVHRALGATRGRQAARVLLEAGLTGLLASALGLPVGLGALHLLTVVWGGAPRAAPEGMLTAAGAGVATALLAGLIPARAALRVSPGDVLRAE